MIWCQSSKSWGGVGKCEWLVWLMATESVTLWVKALRFSVYMLTNGLSLFALLPLRCVRLLSVTYMNIYYLYSAILRPGVFAVLECCVFLSPKVNRGFKTPS